MDVKTMDTNSGRFSSSNDEQENNLVWLKATAPHIRKTVAFTENGIEKNELTGKNHYWLSGFGSGHRQPDYSATKTGSRNGRIRRYLKCRIVFV